MFECDEKRQVNKRALKKNREKSIKKNLHRNK